MEIVSPPSIRLLILALLRSIVSFDIRAWLETRKSWLWSCPFRLNSDCNSVDRDSYSFLLIVSFEVIISFSFCYPFTNFSRFSISLNNSDSFLAVITMFFCILLPFSRFSYSTFNLFNDVSYEDTFSSYYLFVLSIPNILFLYLKFILFVKILMFNDLFKISFFSKYFKI